MTSRFDVRLGKAPAAPPDVMVLFASGGLRLGKASTAYLKKASGLFAKAASSAGYKGKLLTSLDIPAPSGLSAARLIMVGVGPPGEKTPRDWVKIGAYVMGRLPAAARTISVLMETEQEELDPDSIADFTLGLELRSYVFERYKTRRREGETDSKRKIITLVGDAAAGARKTIKARKALADGINLARDLVNEPPNVLFPDEFAARAKRLADLNVGVEILNEKSLHKLGMHALLGVGQGSAHDSRVVVLSWNGAKDSKDAPLAFIGKGVTFDTGGISIKSAAGMEDMKGDMAGAACVVGLMQALAARKARVNAIGIIGLVENMPDGKAQRPGDIVTSMSGQTIEIINTDAEGRLVLADLLWYAQDRFKPRFMIDLATLTGAILISLAHEYAGLFSNDDELAARLHEAGEKTGEKVWRMPLSTEYDKLIDSKFADMKNTGGRHGGSITAAQFLQRFVNKTPWVHLDIAGTAMGVSPTEINRGWASGWGVRLLDRLVADHYEG